MVHHGRYEVGTIESIGEPNEDGVRAIEVSVARDFIVPPYACGYTVGDAVLIRGSFDETQDDTIPVCTEGLITIDGALGGFFDDLQQQGQDGIDFSEPVRRAIEAHARMAQIRLPEPKPVGEEAEAVTEREDVTELED